MHFIIERRIATMHKPWPCAGAESVTVTGAGAESESVTGAGAGAVWGSCMLCRFCVVL